MANGWIEGLTVGAIILGVVIGGIVVAMFLPIFKMGSIVGG